MDNILIIFIGFVVGWVIGAMIRKFINSPSVVQIAKIKEWLLWAVAAAEKELGNGTGKLKLRYVYSMFIQSFPKIAKIISFETFSSWVDEALVRFSKMLQANDNIQTYINSE